MNMKNVFLMSMCIVALLGLVGSVSAIPAEVVWMKINGDEVGLAGTENLNLQRGEDLNIKIKVEALEDIEDVQAYARISGYGFANYEGDLVYDSTDTFDMDADTTQTFELNLEVPTKMEKDDYYLRIYVEGRDGTVAEYDYSIIVKGVADSDAVVIKDYMFNPSQTVYAGRALSAQIRVENIGEDDELNDVGVTLSIPELNVAVTEYMDSLVVDSPETFEELLLRIPMDAEPGVYTIEIRVDFDEYESTTVTDTIEVICYPGANSCGVQPSTPSNSAVVNVPSSMEFTASGAAFPITITNNGNADAVYTLAVQGVTWAQFRFDPSATVIVPAKSAKTVYLYLTGEDVTVGEKYFKLQVTSGADTSEVALSVNVNEAVAQDSGSLRNALEIGLIILVVILIIIGLIIGFSKLKDNSNKDDDDAETYY